MNTSAFFAPLQNTAILTRGTGDPTYTGGVATGSGVTDFEGKINLRRLNEIPFPGSWRVANLIPAAGSGSASLAVAATKTMTVGVGTFVFSMGLEATASGVATFTGTATGSTGTLTANATNRTAKTLTITGAGTIIVTASVQTLINLQLEDVTGKTNQNPGPYVSIGVAPANSAPFHGCGVDGTQYFGTLNGNTVSSNVVTEAMGALISSSTAKYAVLPGYFTTPDSVAAKVTGDLALLVELTSSSGAISGTEYVISKLISNGQSCYDLSVTAAKQLTLRWSTDGTFGTLIQVSSTTAFSLSAAKLKYLLVTFTVNDGVGHYLVKFWESDDGLVWTQVGTTVTGGSTTSIFAGTDVLSAFAQPNGGGGYIDGNGYRAQIYSGGTVSGGVFSGGTLKVDFNPNLSTTAQTFTAATGEVWTSNGGARIFGNTNATYGIPAPWDASVPIGYQAEPAATQYLGVSSTPATQTTASLGTGTYTLWCTGSGSCLASGGTATITGASAASAGVPNTITVTVAGTVTVTVTGSLTIFQLEGGTVPTSYIYNSGAAGTTAVRVKDTESYPTASNIAAAAGSIYLEFTPNHAPVAATTVALWGSYVDANNYTAILHDGTNLIFRKRIAGVNTDATKALTYTANTTYKIAASAGALGQLLAFAGVAGTPHADTAAMQIAATMQWGSDGNGAGQPIASIRNARTMTSQMKAAQLATATA